MKPMHAIYKFHLLPKYNTQFLQNNCELNGKEHKHMHKNKIDREWFFFLSWSFLFILCTFLLQNHSYIKFSSTPRLKYKDFYKYKINKHLMVYLRMKLLFCSSMTVRTIITTFTARWLSPFITVLHMWTWS